METRTLTKEEVALVAKVVTGVLPNAVLQNVEVADSGMQHETVRVSGKLLVKEVLDSSFLLVLPSVEVLAKLS
jgi:hypothetical protein